MEVLHRRLDAGVAHRLLFPADVGLGDHPRAERVAFPSAAGRARTLEIGIYCCMVLVLI
jgi:hypothetical protein